MTEALLYYLIVINVVTFLVYGIDKWRSTSGRLLPTGRKKAKKGSWRISIPFVAHNARFDEGCLKAVFRVYQMDYPDYRFYDTLAAARRQFGHSCVPSVASDQRSSALPNHQLHTVAAACGYDLQNHHHALADAEACAAIALYIL